MSRAHAAMAVLLPAIVAGGAAIGSARAAERHVPAQYATIQAAIQAAAGGDVVIVADGIYTGDGNRDIEYGGKAVVVRSANGPTNCVIDCQGSSQSPHRGFRFHQNETAAAVLDGFTIRNGYALDEGAPCYYSGGGILCRDNANPTIRNCIVTANATPAY